MSKKFSLEDHKHTRNKDGELQPVEQEVTFRGESYGVAEVIPMTYGDAEDKFGEGAIGDVDAAQIAKIFNDHLLDENMPGEIDAKYIRDLPPMLVPAVINTIADASGIPINAQPMQDGKMEVEGMDNAEDLENIDGMGEQGKN